MSHHHPALLAAAEVGASYEAALAAEDRRLGAHYTPLDVACSILGRVLGSLPPGPQRVFDPACGGGVFLLAAAEALVGSGLELGDVAGCLSGTDIDPGAVDAARAALDLWAEKRGHRHLEWDVAVADALAPGEGHSTFDVVIGNPPFQSQLGRETSRGGERRAELRERFGAAAGTPYVDTAALFLLAGVERVRPGGMVAMIQPRSFLASRDTAGVREALLTSADLLELWLPHRRVFRADVAVCAPVLQRSGGPPGPGRGVGWGRSAEVRLLGDDFEPLPITGCTNAELAAAGTWGGLVARRDGVPTVAPVPAHNGRVGDVAVVRAGFRQHYYALVDHVRERDHRGGSPLITCGAIDLGGHSWGVRPTRLARRSWSRPVVDPGEIGGPTGDWVRSLLRPKVLLASQTAIVEAVVDLTGDLVPVTPVVAVMPESVPVAHLAAALASPVAVALLHQRRGGAGLSAGALRVSSPDVADVPLPAASTEWDEGAELFLAPRPDWARFAAVMCQAYGVHSEELEDWWATRGRRAAADPTGPAGAGGRG